MIFNIGEMTVIHGWKLQKWRMIRISGYFFLSNRLMYLNDRLFGYLILSF